MTIKIEKTVYDAKSPQDGKRILVMRLWPRNVRKESADVWMKELGTEVDLIHKFKNNQITWNDFAKEYEKSLKGKKELLIQLANEAKKETITLLCSCKDPEHCHRSLLKKAIERIAKGID
jgi:uncharacterized protein YeaO (DUF488 family)